MKSKHFTKFIKKKKKQQRQTPAHLKCAAKTQLRLWISFVVLLLMWQDTNRYMLDSQCSWYFHVDGEKDDQIESIESCSTYLWIWPKSTYFSQNRKSCFQCILYLTFDTFWKQNVEIDFFLSCVYSPLLPLKTNDCAVLDKHWAIRVEFGFFWPCWQRNKAKKGARDIPFFTVLPCGKVCFSPAPLWHGALWGF